MIDLQQHKLFLANLLAGCNGVFRGHWVMPPPLLSERKKINKNGPFELQNV